MNSLSAQRVPVGKKTKKWFQDNADAIIAMSRFSTYDSARKNIINRNLFNSQLDVNDLSYVTNPYNNKKGWNFPGKLRSYNIIRDKLNVLIGEELKRPFNWVAVVTNPTAVEEKSENDMKRYMDLMKQVRESGGKMTAEEIDQKLQYLLKYKAKDVREIFANECLRYCVAQNDLEEKFNKNFLEYLITGKEVFKVSLENGEPTVRVVNVDNFDCEKNNESEYLDSYDWGIEQRFLTPSDVIDEYGNALKESEVEIIEDKRSGYRASMYSPLDIVMLPTESSYGTTGSYAAGNLIPVYNCVWKGQKKIGILRYLDESGEVQETIIEAPYVPDKEMDVSVEWKWIDVWYEVVKIGEEIYTPAKETLPFYDSLENMVIPSGPYVGLSEDYSLVDIMKPYEYLYDIFMFRMEIAFAKAKDKVFLMDITQVPRQYGMDIDKFLYYLDNLGIAFVNPMEEGVGKFQGKNSAFNQFQALDLSLASSIASYIQVLDKIDNMCRMLVGIPLQRTGGVSQYELVGNVERVMIQSSNITELLFYKHNQVKRRVLERIVDVAKVGWANGKRAQYVLSDMSIASLNIDGPLFSNAYYGIFVTNSTKANKDLQAMRDLSYQAVAQGKATLTDMAKILQTDSLSDMTAKLLEAEQRTMESQSQVERENMEIQKQIHEENLELQYKKIETEALNNIRDNETEIAIKTMELSTDRAIENQKEALEKERLKVEENIKNKEISAKKQEKAKKDKKS